MRCVILLVVGCLSVSFSPTWAADSSAPVVVTERTKFTSPNREWWVFLSSGFQLRRLAVGDRVLALLKEAPPNDIFHVFETSPQRHVVSFTVPDGPPLLRLRTGDMKKGVEKTIALFKKKEEQGSQQLDIPSISATIQATRKSALPCCIVLIGSPVYDGGLHHRGFSMKYGTAPTDATLQDSKLSHLSPFYQGVKDFPEHAYVTILSEESEWGVDHLHRSAVEDTWRKMIHEKGGAHLLRITDAIDSAFNLRGPQVVPEVAPLKEDEFGVRPTTMQSAQESTSEEPLVVFLGRPRDKPPIFEIDKPDPVEELFARAMKWKTASLLAMRWIQDSSDLTFTDLDWHLTTPDNDEELGYDNPVTPYAKLVKDVRYGVMGKNADFGDNWESCIIRNSALPNLRAWIDVFCAVGPIRVNVVQITGGVRTDSYFVIPSRFGDEATDSKHREKSRAWLQVPLPLKPTPMAPSDTDKNAHSVKQDVSRKPAVSAAKKQQAVLPVSVAPAVKATTRVTPKVTPSVTQKATARVARKAISPVLPIAPPIATKQRPVVPISTPQIPATPPVHTSLSLPVFWQWDDDPCPPSR